MAAHPFREDIKAELRKRHGSVAKFERKRGLADRSVKDVLIGRTSQRTAEAIANELGVKVQELFPGRYKSPVGDHSVRPVRPHRQNAEAN